MRESGLLLPVPVAEPTVRELRQRYDPSALHGVPAHITLLGPFVSPDELDATVLAELRDFFGAVEPFAFALRRTGRFPDTLYLAPEPAEPFIRLTEALVECWPNHPSYGGAFDEIVPHLTVAHGADDAVLDAIAQAVKTNLPVEAHADEVLLLAGEAEDGRCTGPWNEIERFQLG